MTTHIAITAIADRITAIHSSSILVAVVLVLPVVHIVGNNFSSMILLVYSLPTQVAQLLTLECKLTIQVHLKMCTLAVVPLD